MLAKSRNTGTPCLDPVQSHECSKGPSWTHLVTCGSSDGSWRSSPHLAIMHMPVGPTGAWSAQFVVPSYMTPFNTGQGEPVTPGRTRSRSSPAQLPGSRRSAQRASASHPGAATGYGSGVGIASTPDGGNYWLVGRTASDRCPVSTSLPPAPRWDSPYPDGCGYWIVARDGDIFCFGDAGFYGAVP